MDLLAQEQTTIYYSGDLDPEGILIAQRLAERYPKLLRYWRFTCEDNDGAVSNKVVSHISLAKLDNIQDPRLVQLAQRLIETKRCLPRIIAAPFDSGYTAL